MESGFKKIVLGFGIFFLGFFIFIYSLMIGSLLHPVLATGFCVFTLIVMLYGAYLVRHNW